MRSTITRYGTGSFIIVPPTFMYSAITPVSAVRRLTSSRNAGGHDHSRPTNNPMRIGSPCILASPGVVMPNSTFDPYYNELMENSPRKQILYLRPVSRLASGRFSDSRVWRILNASNVNDVPYQGGYNI